MGDNSSTQIISNLENIAKRLRIHSLRATSAAGSGHPSSCLSAADLVAALFFYAMRYDPSKPEDPRNDRFVLSKGHAAPLLWGAWCEAGVIPEKVLLNLRKIDSNLEGHPTPRFPWVDVATGSLGQGLSVAVGQALNFRFLDKNNAKAFVLLGDGECAEGSVWEAAGLAAHYHLNNLIAIVDANCLGQSQETMYKCDPAPYAKKFEAAGWKTITLDGHDMKSIVAAFDEAFAEKSKPIALIAKTKKGAGTFMEGKEGWHGKALNPEELKKALQEIGEPSQIKKEIAKPTGSVPEYSASKEPSAPNYTIGSAVATRAAYGEALKKLGEANPKVVALDGDTKNSTYSEKFMKAFPDRFFECFIAEQNMVGVAQGLAARKKIPFVSTFGAFFSRAFDQIRMGGISQQPVKFCGSHAGVSIGEDGPSQMALEDLGMMRAIPKMAVLYPSDPVACERLVFEACRYPGMVYIRTGRAATPVIYPNETQFPIGGCKVLHQSDKDCATLVAAGITLHEALKAYEILKKEGIAVRVIDLYSIKPIDTKTLLEAFYKTGLLITVEDHYPEGGLGEAVSAAVSDEGGRVVRLAVNQIPRSGKPQELIDLCGISAKHIVERVHALCR